MRGRERGGKRKRERENEREREREREREKVEGRVVCVHNVLKSRRSHF